MSKPLSLDDAQRDSVCSLVADGFTIRQAAHFNDTTPRTIQREAQRNERFRQRLTKAKSAVTVRPLHTLREAARTNWRAAVCLMERLEPERFANPSANVVSQSEANQFVTHLVAAIEEGVSSQKERAVVFKLLSVAMPAAMRRRWNKRTIRSKVEWAIGESEHQKRMAAIKENKAHWLRQQRRWDLLREMHKYLPDDVFKKLGWNDDLLDPEKPLPPLPPAADSLLATRSSPSNNVATQMGNVAPPATLSNEQDRSPSPVTHNQPTTSSTPPATDSSE
jgi:hypothetical protein